MKGLSQVHLACKKNLPLNCVQYLNTFMLGHGIGKERTQHASGYGPVSLLNALNECQKINDKELFRDKLFSFGTDENTTRCISAAAVVFRFVYSFLYYVF